MKSLTMCLPPKERSGQPKVLGLLCLGYAASMLAFRPTLTLLLPTLTKEHGLRLEDAGLLISACQVTYMLAKPLFQVSSDVAPASALLVGSELLTGACFAALAVARSRLELLVLFPAIMAVQAPHAAAVARVVTNRFPPERRGGAFSCINATVNVVSCVVPFVVERGAAALGWRRLVVSVGAVIALCGGVHARFAADLAAAPALAPARGAKRGFGAVVREPVVWGVAAEYASMYFVRMAVEGWVGTRRLDGFASAVSPNKHR